MDEIPPQQIPTKKKIITPVPEGLAFQGGDERKSFWGFWDTMWGIPLWRYGVSSLNPRKPRPKGRGGFTLSRVKRKILRHVWLVRVSLAFLFLGLTYLGLFLLGLVFKKTGISNYTLPIVSFMAAPKENIKSYKERTNILILGKGGAGHTASDLTDTIIFSSVSLEDKGMVLVSLPRDIWAPAIRAKINSAYFWGKQKDPKGGIILPKSLVEEIVGQPISYAFVIDFSGFKKIVDILAGIEVGVERGFKDEKYPIAGKENDECGGDSQYKCRYETVEFREGLQHMDGETALKFVRSRNAQGDEGTDLARTKRQQKVLLGLKEKVLSLEVIFSPRKLIKLSRTVQDSVETDMDSGALAVLLRHILGSKGSIESHVLTEDLLTQPAISPRFDNQYVFIPKAGDWSEAHSWINELLYSNSPKTGELHK